MWTVLDYFSIFLKWGILVYSIAITTSYAVLGFISLRALLAYVRQNSFVDYNSILHSPLAPEVSIIAPAYNEGLTIIQNVRSLLSLHYPKFDVIIVNDGSKDDSLQKLIEAYSLAPVEYELHANIETKAVNAVYKSTDPGLSKLIVVDKQNGGKADALNVGLNIANNDWVVCIDVDCIIEDDALLKLVKPFLEVRDKRVIAVGGVVGIANSCEIVNGRLTKVHLPRQFLPRVQVLEYLRAFLLGRMAWAKLDGLLIISGAFGMFDKEIAIKAGGYNHNTVGEDMELVVRMRRYMIEHKLPYTVRYTPDPLCWTEAPSTLKVLGRQRDRWTRGTMETLWIHRKMFMNPKYGLLGMLSIPYWFLFEWLAPWIEAIGTLSFVGLALLGFVNWSFVLALLALVFSFAILISVISVFFEEISFYQYKSKRDIMKLILTGIIEPFFYHPMTVFWALKGNYHKLIGEKSWGVMTRVGFDNQKKKKKSKGIPSSNKLVDSVVPAPREPVAEIQKWTKPYFMRALSAFASLQIALLSFFILVRVFDGEALALLHKLPANGWSLEIKGIPYDLILCARTSILLFPIFIMGYYSNKRLGIWIYGVFASLILMANIGLIQYFKVSSVPLGADFFGYSFTEMSHTVGASGSVNFISFLPFFILIALLFFAFRFASRKTNWTPKWIYGLYALFIIAFVIPIGLIPDSKAYVSDSEYYLVSNKLGYFVDHAIDHFNPEKADNIYNEFNMAGLSDSIKGYKIISDDYPFLHKEDDRDILSPFFDSSIRRPNLVFVLVESLGRGYSGADAYLGSFTPFIDSLETKSLYWENGISGGGRTFAVLSTVFGSLPFADKGFLEMGETMPDHQSLIKILGHNGYHSRFYYGGDSHFDNMDIFLRRNDIGEIIDEPKYGPEYVRLPSSSSGSSWGFGDKAIFKKYFDMPNSGGPERDIFLPLAMHSPLLSQIRRHILPGTKKGWIALGSMKLLKQSTRAMMINTLRSYTPMMHSGNFLRTGKKGLIIKIPYSLLPVIIGCLKFR